jgi:hypothetical protein
VSSKSAVSASTGPYVEELRALLRELGLWGGYTIQTQIDPRDGQPKLLEINPRFGQHLWWRTGLGVNEPQICRSSRVGKRPRKLPVPGRCLLLDPVTIFILLDKFIMRRSNCLAGWWVAATRAGVGQQDPAETLLATLASAAASI